jgi:hypothetical protein
LSKKQNKTSTKQNKTNIKQNKRILVERKEERTRRICSCSIDKNGRYEGIVLFVMLNK